MYNNTILIKTNTIFPLKTAEYLTECNKLHYHMYIYAIALCCTKRLFIVNQQQKKKIYVFIGRLCIGLIARTLIRYIALAMRL